MCVGCGEVLQTTNSNKLGYTTNMENEYCLRCFKIKNYNELISLDDINESRFEEQISDLVITQNKDNKFYYILDVFNLEATRIHSLERILDNDDTTIVINKIDLLPRSTNFKKILEYVDDVFQGTNLDDAEIVLFSSIKKWGLDELKESIEENKNNYFIGKTNVGKSSIINTVLKSYDKDPKIVESYFLNTTMETIKVEIDEDYNIIDTPGVAESNSFTSITNPKDWKLLFFKKELKQYSFKITNNQSFVFGSIFSLNLDLKDDRNVHVYVNKETDLHRTNQKNLESYYDKNFDIAKPRVVMKYKLVEKELIIDEKFNNKNIDIYIQDLGWVNLDVKKGDKITYCIAGNSINPIIKIRKPIL